MSPDELATDLPVVIDIEPDSSLLESSDLNTTEPLTPDSLAPPDISNEPPDPPIDDPPDTMTEPPAVTALVRALPPESDNNPPAPVADME